MTKPIHGGVYLILGLAVAGFSFYLLNKGQNMGVFFYAGLIIAAYGLIKLLIIRLTKEKKPKAVKPAGGMQQQPQQYRQGTKYCSRCGSQIRSQDQYCQYCGLRQY